MGFGIRLTKHSERKSDLAFRVMSWHTIFVLLVLSQVLVVVLSIRDSFFPETELFLNIVGTSAQIISGLYGITLAGYTFFLSRIDALCASDMTLDYVVDSIKRRFKYLIWFITAAVLMNLTISIILMYSPVPEQEDHVL